MLGENLMEGAWFWKAPIRLEEIIPVKMLLASISSNRRQIALHLSWPS